MEEKLKYFKQAKKVSEEVENFVRKLILKERKILRIAELAENKIFELGAKPAWPVNISINEIAAHYTPTKNEETEVKEDDLVKFDIGVHVNGYIYDNAFTICLANKNHPLIKAAEKALRNAIKIVKDGIKVKDISQEIYSILQSLGVRTISNLCGHLIERYKQHAHLSIPNVPNNIERELEAGQIVAIEIFTTTGPGWVKDSWPANIFQFVKRKPVRMIEGRKILELAEKKFEKLPFAKRWIKEFSGAKLEMAISALTEIGALKSYPPLKEEYGKVAVAEKTILVS